mmetsp:Transcript_15581/g.28087  ORF Transcript_15581/g.28087 Transcript_15581/m.28087 type:complete len:111 (+) Transcript_15581:3-335(+)
MFSTKIFQQSNRDDTKALNFHACDGNYVGEGDQQHHPQSLPPPHASPRTATMSEASTTSHHTMSPTTISIHKGSSATATSHGHVYKKEGLKGIHSVPVCNVSHCCQHQHA